MTELLNYYDGKLTLQPIDQQRNLVSVFADSPQPSAQWQTNYTPKLVKLIADIKGIDALIDEIRRDEDPYYVQACLEKDLLAYVDSEKFKSKTLLDFGCGSGASTVILARLLPDTKITGIDLSEEALTIARARAEFYGFNNIEFLCSPSGDQLPPQLGQYDYILFSAVFEHLLPNERLTLLPKIWSLLKPGGTLFLDQTPWRFFPFEGHTSRLPFMNYLPDQLALRYARRFSKRITRDQSWQTLLRRGIRGGSVRQIMKILNDSDPNNCELLKPSLLGIHDRVDLWRAGYAVSIARKHPRVKLIQTLLYGLFKTIALTTRIQIAPSLSLAIRKNT